MTDAAPAHAPWTAAELDALGRETGVAVLRDPAARRAASRDFGGIARGAAFAVALPRGAGEVAATVKFAAARGLRLTPRGRGLSQSGQAIAPAGVLALDLTRLDQVGEVGEVDASGAAGPWIACGAGARFRDVVARAAAHGLVPRAYPLNLDLTVGGVLSVGGVGATVHAHGPVVANVGRVVAVTGTGETIAATAAERRDVRDAVLAGLGRCAVLCEATLGLRRFAPRVTTFQLLYDDLPRFLADQRALAFGSPRTPEHLEAFVVASPHSPGVRLYALHASYEHEAGAPPADRDVLAGLCPWRTTRAPEGDTRAFVARYEPRFEAMVRTGAWDLAHPWVEGFVPAASLAELVPRLLAELPPLVGDGHRIQIFRPDALPPGFAVPASPEVAAFAVVPMGIPPSVTDDVQAALLRVDALLRAHGKRYVSGWLGPSPDWPAHHGPHHAAWLAAKSTLDPRHVFTSALFS